ncbi:MAG: acetylornithine deacetylase [Polyangiales bacterium]
MPVLPPHEELLRELVAELSVSSPDPRFDRGNRAVVEALADYAESIGFRCEVKELANDPRKANLVAVLGEGEGGLLLAGHTDTVPYDDGAWSTEPLELTNVDGRLHGLGAADMKGFFPAALHAIASIDRHRLRAPIVLVATADEESGMEGMRQLVAEGGLAGAHAVIGEPTGLAPVHKHKGVAFEKLELFGRAGHASDPSLGLSALDGMADALDVLRAYREEWKARLHDPAFTVPHPTLNLGRIEGGDSPNRICAHCALHVDVRLLPGMVIEAVRAELRERIEARLEGRGLRLSMEALAKSLPAFETRLDAPIVRAAEEATGKKAHSVLFGTEGPFLNEAGKETVILGAGDISVAHQPDEFVRLSDLERATTIYASLAHRFCVEKV